MRTLTDYTANDLTAPHTDADRQRYARHVERWQTELHPVGTLECWFAAEIARATWRLERFDPLGPDPQTPWTSNVDADAADKAAERKTAWLRYRDRTSAGIRRNLEELRRIQSDRYLQSHLGIQLPGVASLKYALPQFRQPKQHQDPATPHTATIERSEAILHEQLEEEGRRQLEEFRKENPVPEPEPDSATPAPPLSPKPEAPRNALCPCSSGQKYKRCCGHWSKTPLPKAA